MQTLTSADGTSIAAEAVGDGPAVLLIGGAFNDRSTVAGLAAALDGRTAWSYDRRGRGESGSLGPWPGPAGAVEQELTDLAAVLDAVRPVVTVGHSSGASLVLAAAARGLPVGRVAAYEPPHRAERADLADRLAEATPADAVRLFLTEGVGMPAAMVDQIPGSPGYPAMLALGPTLAYDAALVGAPVELSAITVPVTVLAGGGSPDPLRSTAAAIAAAVPGGVYEEVPGEDHAILQRPAVFARALRPLLSPA